MRLLASSIAAAVLLVGGASAPVAAKTRRPAHCVPVHCRASWTLDAGKARTVRSPDALRTGLAVSFIVYANGRVVHERAADAERVTLMGNDVLAVVESPADAPLKARLANFGGRSVRVTIEYWQSVP